MRIGIDLDGVVIDSENVWRVYEEIFAIEELNGRQIYDPKEPKVQGRYDYSKDEQKLFIDKYLLKGSKESNLKPGFLPIYEKLKKLGYVLIVITARGMHFEEMIKDALTLLEENNIVFDKYYWNIRNKVEICQKENIDIMIDDDYKIIEDLSKNNIKTLYFRDTNLKKLSESKGKGVLNQVFSIVLIIINVVILFLSSNTGLSFIAGNGTNQVSYNVAFGLSPVSYVGILSSTKDSNKLPVDFYGLSNTAVFCSLIAFVIHLLFVISVAISIIGLIKNIKGKKLNIFNIFTFVSCAISLVTFILSLIINHNYSSAFEVINLSNSISMGTHFVITIFVLTLVSGVMLLIKQLVIKEKQDN